ncbi:hypothetical protein, partial [Escherichia coli]|uniref:hypothetical protein n=1 Tax=Escherichia coli TaxID=562 RepID=UPI001BAF6F7C
KKKKKPKANKKIATYNNRKNKDLNKAEGITFLEYSLPTQDNMTGIKSLAIKLKIMYLWDHHPCGVMCRLLLI